MPRLIWNCMYSIFRLINTSFTKQRFDKSAGNPWTIFIFKFNDIAHWNRSRLWELILEAMHCTFVKLCYTSMINHIISIHFLLLFLY